MRHEERTRNQRETQKLRERGKGQAVTCRQLSHAGQAPVLGAHNVMHAVQRDARAIITGEVLPSPLRIHMAVVNCAHPLQAAVQALPPARWLASCWHARSV